MKIAYMNAPRRSGIPSGDIDVLLVREITQFQSKAELDYPNAPRPLTGECSRVFRPEAEEERSSSPWWRMRGASYKKKVFSRAGKGDYFFGAGFSS
jgi:hypothetical protein